MILFYKDIFFENIYLLESHRHVDFQLDAVVVCALCLQNRGKRALKMLDCFAE